MLASSLYELVILEDSVYVKYWGLSRHLSKNIRSLFSMSSVFPFLDQYISGFSFTIHFPLVLSVLQ